MSARPRVGLFVTCLVDLMRPRVGFAAAKLLEDSGCEVTVPRAQTCCGQPAWNSGADAAAKSLARQVVDVFEAFDYVVAPSASCAGMIRVHYPQALADDTAYAARARTLAAKTYELVQFLVQVRGPTHIAASCRARICYHHSCSALREMGIEREPRQLLGLVEGLEYAEPADKQVCCGFGGLFSVKYPEISERMADDKLADVQSTSAGILASADLGCLLHLGGRAARLGLPLRIRHVAEILAGTEEGQA
ncbi:MAG: (Fe-S)-binding protein [Rhizomicrobium sp.]